MRSTTFATHSSDPDKDNRVGLKRGGFDRPPSPEEREREAVRIARRGPQFELQTAHTACTLSLHNAWVQGDFCSCLGNCLHSCGLYAKSPTVQPTQKSSMMSTNMDSRGVIHALYCSM